MARAAEVAGWDGLFVWDHLAYVWDVPSADPWVTLAAAAVATSRIRLGTWVTPLPRHRPQVLALTLASLDRLSGGRVTFGVGLGGVPAEFGAFGEPEGLRTRAAMVDEGLELLSELWSGARVDHHGDHFTAAGVTLRPLPIQRPRIPIWIGGESDAAVSRAARWDGWAAVGAAEDGTMRMTPEDVARRVTRIRSIRSQGEPFDVAVDGYSSVTDGELVLAYERAGATWWLESLNLRRGSVSELHNRIAEGPAHLR
ncbi:MAG: TIGR03619 family F420-dependent LLM class oxidoreductase [Candidatus Dormibacteraeota bacterium]|nr:TIGR03619 family F420-dependent LLM class oxidoreductase [Candidatus Dormibacteraeota bacterium]